MAKSDHLVPQTPVSRAGYSDSQSSLAHRGGTQDHSRGEVQVSDRRITKTHDANPHAWENTSNLLHIEDENPK